MQRKRAHRADDDSDSDNSISASLCDDNSDILLSKPSEFCARESRLSGGRRTRVPRFLKIAREEGGRREHGDNDGNGEEAEGVLRRWAVRDKAVKVVILCIAV